MGTESLITPRETSGMTTGLILDYVERELGPGGVTRLLDMAGVDEKEWALRDENRWFTYETKHRLFDAAKELLNDSKAPFHIGQRAVESRVGAGLKLALKAFGSPRTVYQNVIAAAGKFTTTHTTEVLELGEDRARIRFKDIRGVGICQADKEYNSGLLSCVPLLFGLPEAKIRQVKSVEGPGGHCDYEVTWETPRKYFLNGVLAGIVAGALLAVATVLLQGPSPLFVVAASLPLAGGLVNGLLGHLRWKRKLWRQMQEQLRYQEVRQRQLSGSLNDLVSELRIDEVLHKITRHAQAAVGGKEYALLLQTDGGSFSVSHSSDLPQSVIETLEGYAESIAARSIEEPLLIDDVKVEEGLERLASDREMPVGSICLAPLLYKGDRLGFLVAISDHVQGFLPLDLEQLASYAAQAAVALANARLMSRKEEEASKDPLTELLNHREFHERLSHELHLCNRYNRTLTLVMMDLDGFKQVNDELGHREGDRVLRFVGDRIIRAISDGDMAFRIGGDEFALILPQSFTDDAREIVERINASLPTHQPSLSMSSGIAECPRDGKAKDALTKAADLALGRARQIARSTHRSKEREESQPAATIQGAGEVVREEIDKMSLQKQRRQLALANRLGSKLGSLVDDDQICRLVVDELHDEFHYYMATVMKVDEDGGEIVAVAGAGLVHERLKQKGTVWRQPIDKGVGGRVIRTGETSLVGDVRLDPDFLGTSNNVESRSELCAPIRVGERVWGAINLEEPQVEAFDQDDLALINTIADQMGSVLQSAELYEELENAYLATVEALSGALEAKDRYTATHAREIADTAVATGKMLWLTEDELKTLRYAALFHDIGKLGIPSEILNKDSQLEDEEFKQVAQHTVIGQQILAPVPFLDEVSPLVRHAHERWDGNGYPDGLSGEEIPMGSRIIFVCDAYHAMTSNRPYRKAMPHGAALAELREGSGSQFDPAVVDAFNRLVESGHFEPATSAGQPLTNKSKA